MISYIRFVLKHRIPVILFFLCITVFFGYFLMQASISSTIGELFFSNNPDYDRYLEKNRVFGGDALLLAAYSGDDILDPEGLKRLRRVVSAIEKNPDVEKVESLVSAQHVESVGDELRIEDYVDLFEFHGNRQKELIASLTTDPLTKGWMLSRDARTALMTVEFVTEERGFEEAPDMFEEVWGEFGKHGFNTEEMHQGGLVAVFAEMYKQSVFAVTGIFPFASIILFLFVFLMFRRFWPVMVTLAITGMANIWTLGLAIILFGHLNIFTTIVPTLILITCFADVIHLCSAYLLELSHGKEKDEAILLIGKEVGTACAYTSLTTFFGFIALTMVPSPVFKQAGLLMGFGVGIALFMALTLVPIFLSIIPRPRPWRVGSTSIVQGILDTVLEWCYSITARYPRKVVIVFFVILAVSIYGAFQVNFEAQFSKRLDKDNHIRVSLRFFEEQFPGTSPLNIYLETKEDEGLLDPDLFREIASFEEWIEGLEPVSNVISVVDLVRKMYEEINPEMAAKSPLPDTREGLAQLLLLFEMQGGRNLDRLIDYDYKEMVFKARLMDMGVIKTTETGKAIVAEGNKRFKGDLQVDPLGLDFLTGDWVDNIIAGQRRGLIFAFATIALMMIIALRSFKMGLISMFPNALPLLVLLGYIGLFWDTVDTDTLIVLMVAIGIGVDDTIHFLMRLRFEFSKTTDPGEAVKQTLHYSGRAIIMSSVILVAGFSTFSFSEYFSVNIFGTLLPACLIVALAADVLLVPAFVNLGWVRFRHKTVSP